MDEIVEEESSFKNRIKTQLKKYLNSPDTAIIEYHPKSSRVGFEKLLCGSSPDGSKTFVVSAVKHSDPSLVPAGDIGLTRRDFIDMKYVDRTRKQVGRLQIIMQETGKTSLNTAIHENISDDWINFWDRGGGAVFHPMGRKMNANEIENVVNILEEGKADKKYTEESLKLLNAEFPHRRV